MSCCPETPDISIGGSAGDNSISPSMEILNGESADCFGQRAGNSTGRLDDKTDPVLETIENTDVPLVGGYKVDKLQFRLTPGSKSQVTSWSFTCEPLLPAGVTFDTAKGVLNGEFPKESFGKKFKLVVTAEPAINTRSFVFSPAKATGSNSISFIHPLPGSHVTSKFGPRVPPTARSSANHPGVDFSVKPKPPTDVLAAADGKVIYAGPYGAGGNCIIIQHLNAALQPLCRTLYMHLASFHVAKDQQVVAGQKIALEGNTGASTGPHLHFECRLPNNKAIDPLPFIKGSIGVAQAVNANNEAVPGSIQSQTFNGSLTGENVAVKQSSCESLGPGYPGAKTAGDDIALPPDLTDADPFEKAWFFTMKHEVGPHWTTDLPKQPDVAAGKIDTEQQRHNCGFVNKTGFPGGVTKFGIAQNPNPGLKVALIDYETAKKRGYSGYWAGMPSGLAGTKPKTAIMLFDIAFLHGPGNMRTMAKDVSAESTSISDSATVEALCKRRERFIDGLKNADQYSGWYTRNTDLLAYVKGMA